MSLENHIVTLKKKHAHLDERLREEQGRPHPDENTVLSLKQEKLQLKDEIQREELRVQEGPEQA